MPVIATPYSGTNPALGLTGPAQTGNYVVGTPIQVAVDTGPNCELPCQPDCEWVFDRVRIWHVTTGGTRVEWSMHPQFVDPAPHVFQLQAGRTGLNTANDWVNVGLSAVNAFYAIDDTQRLYGATAWTHYRVKVVTPLGAYYSKPEPVYGNLDRGDWLKWKSLVRQWDFQLRHGPGGQEGLLLKRKLYGERCSCLDVRTLEVTQPQHEECYGTGIVGGYFEPQPCIYAEVGLQLTREKLDGNVGTTNNMSVPGKLLSVPQLMTRDVWVDKDTDVRYFVDDIQHIAELRGVPVAFGVTLKPAPLSHVIYRFPIPGINA